MEVTVNRTGKGGQQMRWRACNLLSNAWQSEEVPRGRGHSSSRSIIRVINRNCDYNRYEHNRYPTTLNLHDPGGSEDNTFSGEIGLIGTISK